MDGIFLQGKKTGFLFLLACGVVFVCLYAFGNVVDLTFLVAGVLFCLVAIPAILLNHGAYIHVDENTVKAKYHWCGKLDCCLDDIAFVLPQINTITILLKNGKRHGIMGVGNARQLSDWIRRRIFQMETETPDAIRYQLTGLQAKHKKAFVWLFVGIALMFANIFATMFLTGSREMHAFSQRDWTIFYIMMFIELMIVIGLFYMAKRVGAHALPIEQLKYRLYGAVIGTQPLPSGRVVAVYTDPEYSGRVVVCGFPKDKSVYFCVQDILGDFRLETVYTSEIFTSAEELPEELSAMIDITAHW